MGKGKYKMPTVQQILSTKIVDDPKKEPVWVYLEKEMRANENKKPYNEDVGEWLKFLKDLKHFQSSEARRKYKRLYREIGPPWYYELSSYQREVLSKLKFSIHQDLLEDLPNRTRKSLSDLGVTMSIPKSVLMNAMTLSAEDPGLFIWNLYTSIYKRSPSELQSQYDMDAMILMSCLVFIDLDECVEQLEKLTATPKEPKKKIIKKQKKSVAPEGQYSEYLQKMHVPKELSPKSEKSEPEPFGYKFKLRNQELQKRFQRNIKKKEEERVCKYKFWEPPCTLRNTNPKEAAYAAKLKMLKRKAKAQHKEPYPNSQYLIGGVAFTGGRPRYILTNISMIPTGYIIINAGIVICKGEYITAINGHWIFPRVVQAKCEKTCDCIEKWESTVMDYFKQSKCKCGHLYDFYHEGKAKEKYFYPPNKAMTYWIDKAKIYQMDPVEDFIKDTINDALVTAEPTPVVSSTIIPSQLPEKELLGALLADVSDTPLLIPHLPQANLLNNLQQWVRKRVKGKLTQKQHKQMKLSSSRRWVDLKHIKFRARAFRIPFTLEQLKNMNWSHRSLVQKLFDNMLNDFATRNRVKQLEQTRLWWSTTKYDAYPSKAFLDIFFTYMPGRMKDTFLLNPYSSNNTPKYGAKTCPLNV